MSFLTTAAGLIGGLVGGPTGKVVGQTVGQLGSSLIGSGSKAASGGGSDSGGGGGGAASIQTAFLQDQQARLREQEKIRAGFVTKPRAQLESRHAADVKQSIAAQVIANIASDQEGKAALNSLRNNMFQRQLTAMESPLRNVQDKYNAI